MAHAALRAAAGFEAVCNGVAQHVQADACNPDFSFQRWAPEPREITVTGSEPIS
jgi:hypothetical protein